MEPTKAIEILEAATANIQATRQQHILIQQALEALKKNLVESNVKTSS